MKTMTTDAPKGVNRDEPHEDDKHRQSDALSLFRTWSLLTGEDQLRDQTAQRHAMR
jgi:hypothetical protein